MRMLINAEKSLLFVEMYASIPGYELPTMSKPTICFKINDSASKDSAELLCQHFRDELSVNNDEELCITKKKPVIKAIEKICSGSFFSFKTLQQKTFFNALIDYSATLGAPLNIAKWDVAAVKFPEGQRATQFTQGAVAPLSLAPSSSKCTIM